MPSGLSLHALGPDDSALHAAYCGHDDADLFACNFAAAGATRFPLLART